VPLVRLRFFKPGLNSVSFYSTYGIPLGDSYNRASRYFLLKGPISVSTATVTDLTAPLLGGRQHFLLRRLHSLTGLVFGGYLVVHLIINATLIQGGAGENDVYQLQVNKIHSLPFLWAVEWAFIFLPILYHTFYGIWITFTGQPNVGAYGYAKNWFYVLQRISAMILVLFMGFHVLGMRGLFGHTLEFDPHNATATAAAHMHSSWLVGWVIYPIGILASCYHLANGFWTAGITWGLTVSKGAQKRFGIACGGLFAVTLVCGFLALIALIHHNVIPSH
jgi:succinate dehydrogenase / fumarate reductase, cytochrome b subunit